MISQRGWSWLRRAFLPVSTCLLVIAASSVPLPAIVERPGSAAGIPACVTIDGRPAGAVNGDFMFTTVAQRDATVVGLLLAAVLADRQVIPSRALRGDVRRDEYVARQRDVFLGSTERAAIVALQAAGQPVEFRGTGAAVVEVVAGSPAEGVLRAGDVITQVNGSEVDTDEALIAAIDGTGPLRLRILRDGAVLTETVRPQVQDIDGRRRPVIGVRITTHEPQVSMPLSVEVASGDVGGPSAGLMIGLAIYDIVDDADLAAGRTIAGTGTLGIDGAVGPIENIELKVPAAVRQGAQVFLAPAAQVAQARAAVPDGAGMTVIAVDDFDDAREALARAPVAGTSRVASPSTCAFAAGV